MRRREEVSKTSGWRNVQGRRAKRNRRQKLLACAWSRCAPVVPGLLSTFSGSLGRYVLGSGDSAFVMFIEARRARAWHISEKRYAEYLLANVRCTDGDASGAQRRQHPASRTTSAYGEDTLCAFEHRTTLRQYGDDTSRPSAHCSLLMTSNRLPFSIVCSGIPILVPRYVQSPSELTLTQDCPMSMFIVVFFSAPHQLLALQVS